MPHLEFAGYTIESKADETVLACFQRSGIEIDFSCKSGVCHRCMLKCISGDIPEQASRRLPITHQGQNYLLACQCVPTTDMKLVAKSDEDSITQCMVLSSISQADHSLIQAESYRELTYQKGQHVYVTDISKQHSILAKLVSDPEQETSLSIEIAKKYMEWVQEQGLDQLGNEFYLKGPISAPQVIIENDVAINPALWEALGGDHTVRKILTEFYKKVYADQQLAPFFERVTIDRIIGKQFAFLKQLITGEATFFSEQPRNSHHWMVISDELFEHRMLLMHQTLLEHKLSADLIEQFERYELQFKNDIVKSQAWLKQVGDLLVDTEKYEECQLDEATVCDYCEAEIEQGTVVRFHMRLGKLACKACSK